MPKLKILSGDEVVAIFLHFGFRVISQRGSHVKLQRVGTGANTQTLIVPRHGELDRGTVGAIYRQALRYISENELHSYFFS